MTSALLSRGEFNPDLLLDLSVRKGVDCIKLLSL